MLRRVWEACAPARVHVTGGYLRDRYLGRPSHDLDLVVEGEARPTAEKLASHLRGTLFPLGREPLVTWRVACAPWRLDVWGVAPQSLRNDVMRRDFAVNALLWRLPSGPLIDLAGGLDDLAAGRLRVMGAENLRADPLRVLRGVRLLATHRELSLAADSEALLRAAAPGLARVAGERVADELRQLLLAAGVRRALRTADRLGVLASLHPSWRGARGMETLTGLATELAALAAGRPSRLAAGARAVAPALLAAPAAGFPPSWERAAAAHALTAMGWPPRPAREITAAAAMGEALFAALESTEGEARAEAVAHPGLLPAAAAWAVAHAAAEGRDVAPAVRRLLNWHARFQRRPPLLRGGEVAELLRLQPGPRRGEAVAALRRAHASGEVRTRRDALRWLASRASKGDVS